MEFCAFTHREWTLTTDKAEIAFNSSLGQKEVTSWGFQNY